MRVAIKLIVCVVILLFMSVSLEARQIRVAWVPDGDTLVLTNREVVRLKGIDAPETGYDDESDQYYAAEATKRLEELVSDKNLILKTGQDPRDRYGRTIGYVYLPDNKNLSVLMVREGFAFYYPHQDQDEVISSSILRAQQQAMTEGRGFWPEILSMEKAELTYVGNMRSKRFHVIECGYGQRIADGNKVMLPSLRDAFYEGYAPCRRCTPWPLEENEGLP
jgi:micrococcal nuclease